MIGKAISDGVGPTVAAVQARLDDLLTPGYSSTGTVESIGPEVTGVQVGDRVGCVGANAATHAELVVVPEPLTFRLPEDLPIVRALSALWEESPHTASASTRSMRDPWWT